VKAVALSSYSVYLTHSLMIHLARLIMEKAPGLHWLAYFPLSLMVVAAGGAFFYFFVERSSIRLRDRWVPRRISVTAAPTSQ
jgi:peptidoglycan/LPS O-acetylase OafA/YrhL